MKQQTREDFVGASYSTIMDFSTSVAMLTVVNEGGEIAMLRQQVAQLQADKKKEQKARTTESLAVHPPPLRPQRVFE